MELPTSLKVAGAAAAILGALATVFAAGFGVSYYFAPRARLAEVERELSMQARENDCRAWLLTHVIQRRFRILDEEDNYVTFSEAAAILEKMMHSKTATLSDDQERKANAANKTLLGIKNRLTQYKDEEQGWLKLLLQPTVLKSGECMYKGVPK